MKRAVETVLADARVAFRGMRSNAVVTLAAIGCIGLGIGATATVFSTAMAFTFRPLPQLGDAAELVVLSEAPRSRPQQTGGISAATYVELREAPVFSGVAVMQPTTASLRGHEEPERVRGARINVEGLSVLGVAPRLGRSFLAEDEREGRRVAIISHGLWHRQFGGDAAAVGGSVFVDGAEHTVVGVMPEGFTFPAGTELWQPLLLSGAAAVGAERRSLQAIGRMAPDQPLEEVRARVAALGTRLEREHPVAWDGWILHAERAEKVFGSGPRPYMISMLVAVALVMLIACGNVAMLLLARSATRQREIAIRLALGATRGALLRQFLVESVLLAVLGGVAGLILSLWGIELMLRTVPPELSTVISGYDALRIDGRAVAFALSVSVAAGVLFGLAPALHATRLRFREWLTQSEGDGAVGPRSERVRQALVVGEIALASVLLVSAMLMLQSVIRLGAADPGFDADAMLTLRVTVPQQGYEEDAEVAAFFQRLDERLNELPEVRQAGLVSILPMSWSEQGARITVEGRPPVRHADAERIQLRVVSRDYFDALGVRVLRGEGFAGQAMAGVPVAAVSASAARRLFGNEDPLGRRVRIGDDPREVTITGIVTDVRHNPLTTTDPQVALYVPLEQRAVRGMSVIVRTRDRDASTAAAAVRRAVATVDQRVAAGDMFTMQRVIETATSPQRATAGALFSFGVMAVLLASLGVYGVISFSVARRSRDLAIRRALGADAAGLLGRVLGQSLKLAALGLALGLAAALATGRALQAILFETSAADPLTYVGVAVIIPLVVLLASAVPASRAASVQPGRVLRGGS